jgi:hypothetical protein
MNWRDIPLQQTKVRQRLSKIYERPEKIPTPPFLKRVAAKD